jgi:hypothetical protein
LPDQLALMTTSKRQPALKRYFNKECALQVTHNK